MHPNKILKIPTTTQNKPQKIPLMLPNDNIDDPRSEHSRNLTARYLPDPRQCLACATFLGSGKHNPFVCVRVCGLLWVGGRRRNRTLFWEPRTSGETLRGGRVRSAKDLKICDLLIASHPHLIQTITWEHPVHKRKNVIKIQRKDMRFPPDLKHIFSCWEPDTLLIMSGSDPQDLRPTDPIFSNPFPYLALLGRRSKAKTEHSTFCLSCRFAI